MGRVSGESSSEILVNIAPFGGECNADPLEGKALNMFNCILHVSLLDPLPVGFPAIIVHPLEDVGRYHDPQLQVGEKHSYLFYLGTKMYKS